MNQLKIITTLTIFFLAFSFGFTVEHWRMDSKFSKYKLEIAVLKEEAAIQARMLEQSRQKASNKEANLITAALAKVKMNERTVTTEVTRYVENPNTGNCKLNNDWVRTHNNAATMSINANTSLRVDEKARTITDRDALMAVTRNYAICQERLVLIEGWQKWYQGVSNAN